MNLPIHTINDIRAFRPKPCYDPSRYAPEDWHGTALDVLKAPQVPPMDKIWVVCHKDWIDDNILRLFAVWCAREALNTITSPKWESVNACNVAELFVKGEATLRELVQCNRKADARLAADDATMADISAWCTTLHFALDAAWHASLSAFQAQLYVGLGAKEWRPFTSVKIQEEQVLHLIEMLEEK